MFAQILLNPHLKTRKTKSSIFLCEREWWFWVIFFLYDCKWSRRSFKFEAEKKINCTLPDHFPLYSLLISVIFFSSTLFLGNYITKWAVNIVALPFWQQSIVLTAKIFFWHYFFFACLVQSQNFQTKETFPLLQLTCNFIFLFCLLYFKWDRWCFSMWLTDNSGCVGRLVRWLIWTLKTVKFMRDIPWP